MKKNLLYAILIAATVLLPKTDFAQVNLGTAANFVLFTSNGAVTNGGVRSHLTGNVGTNIGGNTGFGNVNGVMHAQDAATGTAAWDLSIAYTYLNSAIPDNFPAPLLGNGDTLTSGVHSIAAVTTLSGDLYLDAEGDSNATFIIQIQAAFSTNTGAKVKLLNGAQSCNVYWKVEGLVSMAPETFMRGTVIANNAAIVMSVNDTLEGRALSTQGAVTVNGVMAYLPSGCLAPLLTGPAAPYLGVAGCYAIFSGNGAVANAGISYATGDIGTNVEETLGFNQLNVVGMIHPIPDLSTAAAAASLLNASIYLNALPYDIELLYPAQFGQNLVLTPHTYLMNAAATFTDSLYLNAEGNEDAVFVIRINGALTTSTNAKVLLINGTKAENVYWIVNGAVSISDYSILNGTFISNNGAVSLSTGVVVNGRTMTTNGAVSTAQVNVQAPAAGCSLLPLTWLNFTAEKTNNNFVLLNWTTTSETNTSFFEVQRSNDGQNYISIGRVNASNSSNTNSQYTFTDDTPNSSNYYRLKQVDIDNRFTYSIIRQVSISGKLWSLYPNPATTKTTLLFQNNAQGVEIRLTDINGKLLYKRIIRTIVSGELVAIPLTNVGKGIYLLTILTDGTESTERIVVL